ncbi:TPA: hypothetical protein ACIJWR_002033 [Citrobacter sedlakii]
MSVKRYEANGSSSVSEDANGSLVDYSDYVALEEKLAESQREFRSADATNDNLQMKLEKMDAENAGLKNALEWLYEAVSMPDSGPIPDKYYSAVTNAAAVMHETPATDAFLAEVRASALPVEIAEIIDSGDLEAILFTSGHSETERYRMALYNFRTSRKGVQS